MTLFYVESLQAVNTVPRATQFRLLQTRLNNNEFRAAVAHISGLISGDEIHTSSWMPGSDWRGTPLQPIFTKAARSDPNLAAQLFGILVFYTFMQQPDDWVTGRFEKDGEPLPGRTYFRKRY